MVCPLCFGEGWVCEVHPHKPASECCGGAGKPCECNSQDFPTGMRDKISDKELIETYQTIVTAIAENHAVEFPEDMGDFLIFAERALYELLSRCNIKRQM